MRTRILGMAIALAVASAADAQQAQKSSQSGVTVSVTAMDVAAGASTWSFKVVLDTHSQDLSDDLAKSAMLVDDAGREARPLAWEGSGPGGHHREGVLKFSALKPVPEAVELRLTRPGESEPRRFRFALK